MSDAIALRGLSKSFGSKQAVRDLDLVVPQGSMYGFIGPNGAGKTTTIRMIMSILFPDRGEIAVLGNKSALEAKDRIGYLPEERGIYKNMKVARFLRFIATLKGADGPGLAKRIDDWLERVELADVAQKKCEELSKGMQQKIQFISSVLHEPDLLILDEPFSGLDPVNMRLLRDLIHEQHQRGATIVFSTHVMFQAEELCDHVVMIHNGRKVLDDRLEEIRSRHEPRALLFEPLDPTADVSALEGLEAVEAVERAGRHYELRLRDGVAPASIMGAVLERLSAARLEIHRPSLEDVFIEIVNSSRDLSEDDASRLRASLREEAIAEAAS